MEKADIERKISDLIRKAAEEATHKAIHDLNRAGHRFEPIDGTLYEWTEPGSDESLNITCAIGVGFTTRPQKGRPVDAVVRSFISRAESRGDKDATLLNLLEGDIANGGFLQLYTNKGERFIREGIALLRKIGSRYAWRIVEQALVVIREERATLEEYERLLKKLDRLNSRFWNLKESIPVLYERYRQQREG